MAPIDYDQRAIGTAARSERDVRQVADHQWVKPAPSPSLIERRKRRAAAWAVRAV